MIIEYGKLQLRTDYVCMYVPLDKTGYELRIIIGLLT